MVQVGQKPRFGTAGMSRPGDRRVGAGWLAAALLAVGGCQATLPVSEPPVPVPACRSYGIGGGPPRGAIVEYVRAALEARGYMPGPILLEERRRSRRRADSRGGDDRVIGFRAWAEVDACPAGKLVVELNRLCTITQIYGRYGCRPDARRGA